MRRIGSLRAGPLLLALAMFVALPAAAELDFSQSSDREEVGTEDTFRLTVVVVDPPASAELELPETRDFEVLSSSQSTQRSIEMRNNGSPVMQTVRRYVFLMRARRAGALTLPPAELHTGRRTFRTEPVHLKVRKGRVSPPPAQAAPSPRSRLGLPGAFPDPFAEDLGMAEVDIPRGDSDLFLKAVLDREEVYVGEQVTLSLYIFSRVDLSSVDAVTLPKLEGFWSEDLENPSQLTGEQKLVRGVPYRTYLLRRRALFPVKAGTLNLSPAEADITTGFLFAGHRVHRASNALTLVAKPLPPKAPPGMSTSQVGQWQLSLEASPSRVKLGEPVNVKVALEGRGNLRNILPPPLIGPPALKIYEPKLEDKGSVVKGRIQGRRIHEYLVVPQRTGTFTLPALRMPYFDPKTASYQVATTEPFTVVVEPGTPGATAAASSNEGDATADAKNVLTAGGLRPLRYRAQLSRPVPPLWQQPWFGPLSLAPLILGGLFTAAVQLKGRRNPHDAKRLQRDSVRQARKRLAAATQLKAETSSSTFYAEVEQALLTFLSARLGSPAQGLTREALDAQLFQRGVSVDLRRRILAVLDACDAGRFAPGAEGAKRERILAEASKVMEEFSA